MIGKVCLGLSAALAMAVATDASASPRLQLAGPATVSVWRGFSVAERDWVSVPGQALPGYAFQRCPQFRGLAGAVAGAVAIHRWYHPRDRDWVILREGEIPAATLHAWGYRAKTLVAFAYRTARPGTVAVYRWYHAGDRDWVTLRDGEIPDGTLRAWGYRHKRLQFYALPSGPCRVQSSTEVVKSSR